MTVPVRFATAVLVASLLACLAGCGPAGVGPERGEAELTVFVSIPPQAYLARQVGGERVEVHTLLEPADNPHTFDPTPHQVSKLGAADLYFTVGIGLEQRLVERVSRAGGPRVVEACRGIERRSMSEPLGAGGSAHEHDGMKDPHTWLDPLLATQQAENMCGALKEADPEGSAVYERNLAALRRELEELDGDLKEILEPVRGREIYVFHPAFGYFADRYGLRQVPIQAGGASPGARHLSRLIKVARAENVQAIFVQPQYSRRDARAVARGVGAEVVPLDPLAGDYARNLEEMARRIRRTLTQGKETDGR